jgi:hypothetical protein
MSGVLVLWITTPTGDVIACLVSSETEADEWVRTWSELNLIVAVEELTEV